MRKSFSVIASQCTDELLALDVAQRLAFGGAALALRELNVELQSNPCLEPRAVLLRCLARCFVRVELCEGPYGWHPS